MIRNKIIISFVGFVVIIIGFVVVRYALSIHSVHFTLSDDFDVVIYKKNENSKLTNTINTSSSVSLQNGDYCAEVKSKKYSSQSTCFTVDGKDVAVLINPDYTNSVLSTMLSGELAKLKAIITSSYPQQINDFTIQDGALFGRGEWYGTTLTKKVSNRSEQSDVYRLILKKKEGKWEIVAYPQIVLSKITYKDIPENILVSVNDMVGEKSLY